MKKILTVATGVLIGAFLMWTGTIHVLYASSPTIYIVALAVCWLLSVTAGITMAIFLIPILQVLIATFMFFWTAFTAPGRLLAALDHKTI